MMISLTAGLRSWGIDYGTAIAIQIVISFAVVISTVVAVRHMQDRMLRAFVVVTAVPLISLYGFNYHLTASAAVIAWLIVGPFSMSPIYRTVLLLAWLSPALVMAGHLPELTQLLLIATFLIGLKLVWLDAFGNETERRDGVFEHPLMAESSAAGRSGRFSWPVMIGPVMILLAWIVGRLQ